MYRNLTLLTEPRIDARPRIADQRRDSNRKSEIGTFGTSIAASESVGQGLYGLEGAGMAQPVDIIGLLEAGIQAEGLRQKAIASNIANIETPGYRRLEVKFEELLAKALASDTADLDDMEPEVYQPKSTPVKSNGNDVNMEAEVGELLKNSLRHTAYVRLLRKKLSQIEMAMNIRE
jgi:flagellar basal-body rod protein FlgB